MPPGRSLPRRAGPAQSPPPAPPRRASVPLAPLAGRGVRGEGKALLVQYGFAPRPRPLSPQAGRGGNCGRGSFDGFPLEAGHLVTILVATAGEAHDHHVIFAAL